MSMQKTIGGERLGAGKKMKVELHGFERSTHDLSYSWRSSMAPGTLVPFMKQLALPGDTFDIELNTAVNTLPTIGPLFGSYKAQFDVFLAPIRLYQAKLHNNQLDVGMNMANVKLPVMAIKAVTQDMTKIADIDNSQINPSCILSYLGIRGVGYLKETEPVEFNFREFQAIPYLAYWEIFKNYYANKQEEKAYVIHNPPITPTATIDTVEITNLITTENNQLPEVPDAENIAVNSNCVIVISYTGAEPDPKQILINYNTVFGTIPVQLNLLQTGEKVSQQSGTPNKVTYNLFKIGNTGWAAKSWEYMSNSQPVSLKPNLYQFNLANIDLMRNQLMINGLGSAAVLLNDYNISPYITLLNSWNETGKISNFLGSQEGLAVKTYQSDLFNNWMSTEWIDGEGGINDITAIDTSGGYFNIDTLILSKKVYTMLTRIAISGGTYDDWLDAVYTHDRYRQVSTPMYMGGLSKEIVFQEVISNSDATANSQQPLGTLAGKGVYNDKHKGGKITIKVDEPSYIIGIVSITPRLNYSQGNDWDNNLMTMDDLHKPSLDEIGFQDLGTEQMAWWDVVRNSANSAWLTFSAGKQPAWINYMTNVDKTYGNFAIASADMFMTMNRRYEAKKNNDDASKILDLTTYIDPAKHNYIFAQSSLDAQNFWMNIHVGITARRKMSAKVMPNL